MPLLLASLAVAAGGMAVLAVAHTDLTVVLAGGAVAVGGGAALGSVALQTRIKMKRTTWVRAILETSTGDVWADYAHVNVSLNGCG